MLGFSLYPHHLKGGSDCTLQSFCEMVARVAEKHSPAMLGIGSDLCQNQPDAVVQWMRDGRWRKDLPTSGKAETGAKFPAYTSWFASNEDFQGIASGLREVGFSEDEVKGIMAENWIRFYDRAFQPGGA